MAEYFQYNMNMNMDPHLPSLAAVAPIKKEQLSPKQAIDAVRVLMNKEEGIDFTRKDDAFIMRFLNARKMVTTDAFQLILNYITYRQRNHNLFANLSLEEEAIRSALLDGFPGVLNGDDRKGRCVLIIFTANWDHNAYSLITVYQALLLVMEKFIEGVRYQENGFVMIVDWTDFSFRQSSNLNPKVLKLMLEGLQDCFPARFKGIHFINQPWYVEAALTVIRPFLKDKTKRKIYLHGNNLSTLHEHVSKYILPAELGGDGPSFSPSVMANAIISGSLDLKTNYFGCGVQKSSLEREKVNLPAEKKDSDTSSDEEHTSTIRKSETVPAQLYSKQKLTRTSGSGHRSVSSTLDDALLKDADSKLGETNKK